MLLIFHPVPTARESHQHGPRGCITFSLHFSKTHLSLLIRSRERTITSMWGTKTKKGFCLISLDCTASCPPLYAHPIRKPEAAPLPRREMTLPTLARTFRKYETRPSRIVGSASGLIWSRRPCARLDRLLLFVLLICCRQAQLALSSIDPGAQRRGGLNKNMLAYLRSTCGGQWRDRSRRTPAWRSTSAGR